MVSARSIQRTGFFLYGPPNAELAQGALRFGLIGTREGIELFGKWEKLIGSYIPPFRADVAHHSGFPGFQALFGMAWPAKPTATLQVDGQRLERAIRITNRHEAIKSCVDIYADAITEFLAREADVTPYFGSWWFRETYTAGADQQSHRR